MQIRWGSKPFRFLGNLILLTFCSFVWGCMHYSKAVIPSYQEENLRRIQESSSHIQSHNGKGQFTAGVAKEEITPPVGTPLAGFGKRRGKPSVGVLDPLWARALVLSDGKNRIVLVSLDMMAVHKNLFDTVYSHIDLSLNVSREDLFLMASHTHAGSGGLTDRWAYEQVSGKFNRKLLESTAAKIARAINVAGTTQASTSLSVFRKEILDFNENRMIPNGKTDNELIVLRVNGINKTINNSPMAILVNFSAHPTILGANNLKFSGDFIGPMTQTVENEFPETLCLFANGSAGDLKPNTTTQPSEYEETVEFGHRLASEVIQLVQNGNGDNSSEIMSIGSSVKLPPVRLRWGWLKAPAWIGNRFFSRETTLNAARVGNTLFLSCPGELSSAIGLDIKNEVRKSGLEPIILGYTNDYVAYIITSEEYALDEYESEVSFYGPRLGEFVKTMILAEADLLKETKT